MNDKSLLETTTGSNAMNYTSVRQDLNSTQQKIFSLVQIKAFAGDNSNITRNIEFVFHTIENIVGKGEILLEC